VPLASSRACFGPIGGRLKNRLLEMGLKGFRPPRPERSFLGWSPMDRMGSYGHQRGPEVPLASSRACVGPIGGRLKNRLLEMGLQAFRPLRMKGV